MRVWVPQWLRLYRCIQEKLNAFTNSRITLFLWLNRFNRPEMCRDPQYLGWKWVGRNRQIRSATASGQMYDGNITFYNVLLWKGVKSQIEFHKLHKRSTSCEIKEAFPSASVSAVIGRPKGRDKRLAPSLSTESGWEIPPQAVLHGQCYQLS